MVTRIEDIKNAGVQEVALSGFVPEEPFYVKLRRPSLMRLAKEGKIPNQLLGSAAKLFGEGTTGMTDDGEKFKELSEIYICLAKASLVEPSFDELEKAGIELTDPQLMEIYLYTQKGVRMLEGFRKEPEPEPDSEPSKEHGEES